MNNKAIIIISLCLMSIVLNAQVYDFPIKPGTEKWGKLSTHEEKISVCQIPSEKLSKISTKDLIETCLNYPLLIDMLAYPSIYEGVMHVSENFNGLKELLKRKDNSTCLVNQFTDLHNEMRASPVNSKFIIGERIVQEAIVETLLSFEEVQSNLTDSQSHNLSLDSYDFLKEKVENSTYYDYLSVSASAYLFCKLISKDTSNSNNIAICSIMDNKVILRNEYVSEIINLYSKKIKEQANEN